MGAGGWCHCKGVGLAVPYHVPTTFGGAVQKDKGIHGWQVLLQPCALSGRPGRVHIWCRTQHLHPCSNPAVGTTGLAHLQHSARAKQHLHQHMASGRNDRVTWWAPSNTRSCRPSSCSLPACCWRLTSPTLLAVHQDAALWPTEMPPGQAICLKVQLQQGTLQAGTTHELPSPSPRHVALPRKDPDLSHWVSRSCSVAVHQHAGHRVPRVAGRLCRGGLHRPILLPGDLIVVNVLGIKCCLAVGKVEPAGQLLELNLQHRI